ncbi:hypothetical protein GCM10028793_20400 [Nocardiopsis oceani]
MGSRLPVRARRPVPVPEIAGFTGDSARRAPEVHVGAGAGRNRAEGFGWGPSEEPGSLAPNVSGPPKGRPRYWENEWPIPAANPLPAKTRGKTAGTFVSAVPDPILVAALGALLKCGEKLPAGRGTSGRQHPSRTA